MKINIEVDCTPHEARSFLGLPDVAPMQKRLMEEAEARMVQALDTTDPQTLLDQWLPLSIKGMEQWQALFGQMLGQAGFGGAPAGERKGERKPKG